ncbi:MAG TPA: DUF2809 domain-containing protein [Flavobacterium sp.]|uniref:ribosomal maturation YjgA family protein n=1 Tax=Flavobacterium sp. TaxID=239 RepID=UPI002B516F70|nr:DUF2809 domain-containing protein [Flavobacterium sp.]
MFKFNQNYFIAFSLLLFTEIFIALYVNDSFIRPYFGDYLVVILIYCFVMSILVFSKWKTAFYVLFFAFVVEFLQYLDCIKELGLQNNKFAKIIIGTSFSWHDVLCYILGYFTIVGFEILKKSK